MRWSSWYASAAWLSNHRTSEFLWRITASGPEITVGEDTAHMLNVASALGSASRDTLLLRGAEVMNPQRPAEHVCGPPQRIQLPSGSYYWIEAEPSEQDAGNGQLDDGVAALVRHATQGAPTLPNAAATLAAHALWSARHLTIRQSGTRAETLGERCLVESKSLDAELPTAEQLLSELEALDNRLLAQLGECEPPTLEDVLDRARRLVSPTELADRRAREERFRVCVAQADTLWAHGARRAALLLLRGEGQHSQDGRLQDLAAQRERDLITDPDVPICVDGVRYIVMFGPAIWLGRGARINIPSPVVSRTQLLFSRDERGPTVAEKGASPISVTAPEERIIAGVIRLLISPEDGGPGPRTGLLIETAGTKYWLALSDQLDVGLAKLRRSEAAALPSCQLLDDRGFILTPRDGAPRRVLACDIARGDHFELEDGRTLAVN